MHARKVSFNLNSKNRDIKNLAAYLRHINFCLPAKIGVMAMKQLGLNIQKLRTQANLTQNELCDLADIDRSFVQRIESGANSPSAEVLVRLRRALKCSWDQLFQDVDDDLSSPK